MESSNRPHDVHVTDSAPHCAQKRSPLSRSPPQCRHVRVAGMVPPGQTRVNPAVNAVQSLVAREEGGRWLIHLFQNTPAAFHGRPDAAAALTAELQARAETHELRRYG